METFCLFSSKANWIILVVNRFLHSLQDSSYHKQRKFHSKWKNLSQRLDGCVFFGISQAFRFIGLLAFHSVKLRVKRDNFGMPTKKAMSALMRGSYAREVSSPHCAKYSTWISRTFDRVTTTVLTPGNSSDQDDHRGQTKCGTWYALAAEQRNSALMWFPDERKWLPLPRKKQKTKYLSLSTTENISACLWLERSLCIMHLLMTGFVPLMAVLVWSNYRQLLCA